MNTILITSILLFFLIIILFNNKIKFKKENFSNIKFSNGYFIISKENQKLYQDYIDTTNNIQAPMLKYNICTKGYNHLT